MIQSRGEVNSTHFWCGAVLIKLRMQVQHSSQNISCEILLGMVINTENILVEGIWEGLSFFIFYFLLQTDYILQHPVLRTKLQG